MMLFHFYLANIGVKFFESMAMFDGVVDPLLMNQLLFEKVTERNNIVSVVGSFQLRPTMDLRAILLK
jgi:hypothetical protein